MTRNLARLTDNSFDALVVGGGIYGLSTAHALVQLGLSVALLERGDFGGATSFNSLKTIHGGIRALQHGSIRNAREFVRQRRAIAKLAPHLVRVLPFVVPTARHLVRNRAAMRAFLCAYDAISADRNKGLDPAVHLPSSYTTSRRDAIQLNPLVDPQTITGAAVWHDYQLHSPERFALALARTITDIGGTVANYVTVQSLLRRETHVIGVRAADTITGQSFDIRAPVVINAAGPWAWRLLASFGGQVPRDAGFSLALNLVLDHPPLPHAVGGVADGRFLFVVPWRDRSILGTSHEGFRQGPPAAATSEDVANLLRAGATAFPALALDRAGTIRLVHRGLLPARARGTAHAVLLKHSAIHDHRAEGISGLISILGVRYTTARATAQTAADLVCERLGRRARALPLGPLAGAVFGGLSRYLGARESPHRLIMRYGTLHTELPGRPIPIAEGCDVTDAEILHAVRREMAVTLADVALRRTDLAAGGDPGREVLEAAAAIMAAECQWSEARTREEIAALEQEIAFPDPTAW